MPDRAVRPRHRTSTAESVNDLVATAAASTLRLVVLATILAIVIGVILGIVTAIRQYSGFDYAVTFMAFVFFSLPVFWLAVLLKHYAAIEFNNWIVEATFSSAQIIGISLVLSFIIAAALGGAWKRRLISFGRRRPSCSPASSSTSTRCTWFRRPAIGIPVYVLAVLGAAALVIVLTSGFQNHRVRNAVGAPPVCRSSATR